MYKKYCECLNIDAAAILHFSQIPFLPISFFKSHDVICENLNPQLIFTSSGTSGTATSRHLVADENLYVKSFMNCFTEFYGNVSKYCILALLPSYLERSGSSLIYMTEKLIEQSSHPMSGFFLHDHEELKKRMLILEKQNQPVILLGVTYALLDLFEDWDFPLTNTIIMETGGMKGKRKEITREELYQFLQNKTSLRAIHAEYGMTELLSQAYSKKDGRFYCPSWMQVFIRDVNDPFSFVENGQTGCINMIDLANLYSCSFIATEDLGRKFDDGSFEVLGRVDLSDVRGCNLLVA